jgi:hypothetical protein
MSHVGFRSLEDEAEIGGRERAFCGGICEDVLKSVVDAKELLRRSYGEADLMLKVLGIKTEREAGYLLSTFNSSPTIILGESWDSFTMSMNTAMIMGSDPVRLAARVHGQCEVHGFVEGPNRAWLADIIDEGLATGIMRYETQGYGKGWEDVSTLLRSRDDGPVVMDYSVCDGFPARPDDFEGDQDDWYELDYTERWELAVKAIRKVWSLELKPDNWKTIRFGENTQTGLDLKKAIYDEMSRLRKLKKNAE